MHKKNNIVYGLDSLLNLPNDPFRMYWAALRDGEMNVFEVYEFFNGQKDQEVRQTYLNRLLSLLFYAPPVSNNFTITISDAQDLNAYFASVLHTETGFNLKMGVKDSNSLRIIHSELMPPTQLYSGAVHYMKYATADNDELSVMILETLFSSLLSILNLCLKNLKQPSNTVKS